MPGVAVVNAGVSGQTAAEIVARQGGAPTRLTLSGGAIPTSGPVVVGSATVNIFAFALDPNAAGSFGGTLAGVRGTYAADGAGRQTFTRATAGSVVPVAAGTPFLTSLGEEARDDAMFLCVGRNGIETERAEDVVELTRLAVEHLSTADRRHVMAGVMPDLTATIGGAQRAPYDRLNALLRTTWGAAYLDLATPPTDAEMAAIGYAPSAADRSDIATGVYPRGMFQDTIHLRAAGQRIWAARVRDHLRDRGYIAG
jgi:lysophospholipase L1-like esterase